MAQRHRFAAGDVDEATEAVRRTYGRDVNYSLPEGGNFGVEFSVLQWPNLLFSLVNWRGCVQHLEQRGTHDSFSVLDIRVGRFQLDMG